MTGYLSATPSTVQQIAAGVNTAQTNRGDLAGVTAAQSGELLLAALSPQLRELPPPPPRPRYVGVYLLIDGCEVVYVGQSIDIEVRVVSHRVAFRGARVTWIPVDEHELDAYEGALIRAFRPRGNLSAPAHTGRDNEILVSLGLPAHEDEDANAALWVAEYMRRRKADRR